MDRWMKNQTHTRFLSANQKLRDFLRRAEGLATKSGTVTEKDLKQFSMRLMTLAPEIGDASRSETLDTSLQHEIAEYVKNLRALQGAGKGPLRHAGSPGATGGGEAPHGQAAGLG